MDEGGEERVYLAWGWGKPGQTNLWGKNRNSKLRGVNVQEEMELTRVIRKRNETNCECHHYYLEFFFSISSIFVETK